MSANNNAKPAVKKTRFHKEKEEREARKRQEDAEAAKIYEQFVASFDAGDGNGNDGKRFVRARDGSRRGSSGKGRAGLADDGPSHYQPQMPVSLASKAPLAPLPTAAFPSHTSATAADSTRTTSASGSTLGNRSHGGGSSGPALVPGLASANSKKGPRQIDAFLEELKQSQESGVSKEETCPREGSLDDGDPHTTNLHVGNLSPLTTEERLEAVFGRFGRVYSVKIMWPRSEEERARGRNTGFVSFYTRADAEDAKDQLQDFLLDDHRIGIGWSKAVKKLANLSPSTLVSPSALPPGLSLPPSALHAASGPEEEGRSLKGSGRRGGDGGLPGAGLTTALQAGSGPAGAEGEATGRLVAADSAAAGLEQGSSVRPPTSTSSSASSPPSS
ncbi:U2-associated protein SR140, partial [Nannochloropsis gaditana CCMP526]